MELDFYMAYVGALDYVQIRLDMAAGCNIDTELQFVVLHGLGAWKKDVIVGSKSSPLAALSLAVVSTALPLALEKEAPVLLLARDRQVSFSRSSFETAGQSRMESNSRQLPHVPPGQTWTEWPGTLRFSHKC
jgi:hypothetical protein